MAQDEFDKKITEESAKSLVQLALSIFSGLKNKAIDEIKIRKATSLYYDNYINRNGYIKVLGMVEPRPVQEIYTNVIFVYPSYLNKEKEIESLEQAFKESKRQFVNDSINSGVKIANEKNKLNILGPPGSGKSTFLKRLGILALLKKMDGYQKNEEYIHDCIPILIELKRFRNETIDLKSTIQKEFEIAGFPESQSFVERALKEGKLLILLDGLDEVPKNKLDDTIESIRDFTDKYKKNRFVTSCRTAFYKTYFKSFVDIEIAPFNNKQVKDFIKSWFNTYEDRQVDVYSRFTNLLFDRSHQSTLELARTPLLLTFLCLTFDESQRFPANRSNLYKRALYILLEKWAAEKRIHNDDIYQALTSELEVEMLSEISANFYISNKIFFYTDELKKSIKVFLENSAGIKSIDISKVLEAIEVQQGLLVQRAPDIYSFSHLTIQEYLTAYHFNTPKGIERMIQGYLFDKRWREVFLLLAGIGQSSDMLSLMMNSVTEYIKEDKIYIKIKSWIEQTLNSTSDYENDACKRVFLVSLILQSIESDGYFNNGNLGKHSNPLLASLNASFAKSFSLKNTLNSKNCGGIAHLISDWSNKQNNRKHSKIIDDSFLTYKEFFNHQNRPYSSRQKALIPFYFSLNVPSELIFVEKKDYQNLINYLDTYTLIVDCKKSSLRLAKDTWKTICLNLLK